MPFLADYAAILIIVGQILAVAGVLIVLGIALSHRLQERVESGEKPERTGLPYPDLYYWHVLRQRSSFSERVKRLLNWGKYEGM